MVDRHLNCCPIVEKSLNFSLINLDLDQFKIDSTPASIVTMPAGRPQSQRRPARPASAPDFPESP